VACIPFLMSGCLYLHGPWYLIPNSPPEQVTMSPRGAINMADTQSRTVLIEFYDPDGDDIIFEWFVAGRPERRVNVVFEADRLDGDRLIQGSVLTVDRDEVEDGTVIECLVSDGDPELPPRTLRWVVVEQET